MAAVPPEKQFLLHTVYITVRRNHVTRCKTSHITGKLMMLCRHVDLKLIMDQYPDIASYHVLKVEDSSTGKEYPELKTGIIQNEKE